MGNAPKRNELGWTITQWIEAKVGKLGEGLEESGKDLDTQMFQIRKFW